MVQNIINIGEREDRVLNIVKAMYGLKNKSEAVALIVKMHEDTFLEPELRPEYVEKLNKIRKGKYTQVFASMEEFDEYMKSKDA